jgi:hypothetical protein
LANKWSFGSASFNLSSQPIAVVAPSIKEQLKYLREKRNTLNHHYSYQSSSVLLSLAGRGTLV